MRAAALGFVALLLLAAAPAPAKGVVEARWEYVLSIPDPASGNVRVELTLRGLDGSVKEFVFSTSLNREPVSNITGGPRTPIRHETRGIAFEVDGDESFSYDVKVERPAFIEGQVLSHAGPDFALFKAESISIAYTYSYYEGTTFLNRTTVRLLPPSGWQAQGPWRLSPDGVAYELPAGEVLPRGYVAMGLFLAKESRIVGEKTVHYVRLGRVADYEEDNALYDYIQKATPYYAAVYGPGVEKDVLVVNAPDPMFRGGLGGANSFFVHESADLRTVAHEYAHVFQLFGTNETRGASSIWINEGDADYHSVLSLYAANMWSPSQVNEFMGEAARASRDAALSTARLPDAAYGTSLERFAYQKGTLVMRALDVLLHERSGGDVSLSDVLRELNRAHGDPSGEASGKPVENDEMQRVAERLLGQDLEDFFARYVRGTQWPVPYEPFVPDGQLVVESLRIRPERAAPGEPVEVVAEVVNRGTKAIEERLDLLLDGLPAGRANVSLDVGQNATLRFPLVAPASGDHKVKLLYATATLRSLTPANVTIARVSFVPTTVRAGEPASLLVFLENQGEMPGTARVEARRGGDLLAATTETIVEGASSAALTLPVAFAQPGNFTIDIELSTPQGDRVVAHRLAVAPPDADSDGVVDALDAYPDDPSRWEKSFANDVRGVPGVGLGIALVALALVALARRR